MTDEQKADLATLTARLAAAEKEAEYWKRLDSIHLGQVNKLSARLADAVQPAAGEGGLRDALFDFQPDFLNDPEAGKEPSIREIVTSYYREHLEDGDAKFYADRYLAALSTSVPAGVVRCAECDCPDGADSCNWITPPAQEPTR